MPRTSVVEQRILKIGDKYGKLQLLEEFSHPFSKETKINCLCDCGKEKDVMIRHLLSGATKSCGKCNEKPSEYWNNLKFGKLQMKFPQDIHINSNKKVDWICDCGREKFIGVTIVTSGRSKSCGRCNSIFLTPNEKFGKLSSVISIEVLPGSHDKIKWKCECGNTTLASITNVLTGQIKSCGRCNVRLSSWWKNRMFGHLTLVDLQDLSLGSGKKVLWKCSCGNLHESEVRSVVKGDTKSCGSCCKQLKTWYAKNRNEIRKLKTPIVPKDIPAGFLELKSPVMKTHDPVSAICFFCKNEYFPRWFNIQRGSSLSCGCIKNQSGATHDLANTIKSFGINCCEEYSVNGLSYDLFIPNKNLLIEYQGLRWHSFHKSCNRDKIKWKNAIGNGFDFISIFEDEWIKKRDIISSILRNRLGVFSSTTLRASKIEIRKISSVIANNFLDKHHYIGKSKSKVYYGAFHGDTIVSCASFSNPTRQSSYQWELQRMASNGSYKIHGIWSRILKHFFKENGNTSIVSFSDNRLFSGKVYEKLGFKLDGEIRPDYYWVKGSRRYHKSGLRKTPEEKLSGKTESVLRTEQGYRKIYDLGKKRWILYA